MKWIFFTLLSIIFIVSPFLQGLYFDHDFYKVQMMMMGLFFFYLLGNVLFSKSKMENDLFLIFLIPLCFIFSYINAASPKGAVDSIVRWTTYSVFFIFLYQLSKDIFIRKALPYLFQISGWVLAVSMILFYFEVVPYRGDIVAGRFGGVFQYPNTFGMVMAVFYLFSLMMVTKEKASLLETLLYGAPLLIFLLNVLLSYSRGVFILLPFVWLAGLVLLSARKQLKYVVYTILSILFSILAVFVLSAENTFLYMILYLAFIGSILAVNKYVFTINWRRNRFVLPVIVMVFSILTAMDLYFKGLLYRILPDNLQQRISSISLETGTAKERFIFAEDAMKVIKESPVIGHGGDAWRAIYKTYQSLPYQSTQIHNSYLDLLVSIGWLGLMVFILVFGYYYLRITKQFIRKKENTQEMAVIISSLMLLLHSVLDFNFSFGTVMFMLLWLIVMGLDQSHILEKQSKGINKIIQVVVMFALLLPIALSFRFIQGYESYQKVSKDSSVMRKEVQLEKIISLDPFETKYLLETANVSALKVRRANSEENRAALEDVVNKLVMLEPNNSDVLFKSGKVYEKAKNHESAIKLYDQAIKIDKYHANLYESNVRLKVGMAIKDNSLNMELLESALKDYEMNKYYYDLYLKSKPKGSKDEFNSRYFEVSQSTIYHAGIALLVKGKYSETIRLIENELKNEKASYVIELTTLLYISYQKVGDHVNSEKILHEFKGDRTKLIKEIDNTILRLSNKM